MLVAAEEGALDLDEPAGPPGSTVRHLLAHASGLPFTGDDADCAAGGAADLLEHRLRGAGRPRRARARRCRSRDYLAAAVLEPLGMNAELRGSPAADLLGTLDDLILLARRTARRRR